MARAQTAVKRGRTSSSAKQRRAGARTRPSRQPKSNPSTRAGRQSKGRNRQGAARTPRNTGRGWTVENPDEPDKVRKGRNPSLATPRAEAARSRTRARATDVGDADDLLEVGRENKDGKGEPTREATRRGPTPSGGEEGERTRDRRAGLGFREDE